MDTSGYMIDRATSPADQPRTKPRAEEDAQTLDDTAFRAFYQQHGRAVWSYLYRMIGNAAQADDVMQETFCRFLTAPVARLDDSERRAYVFRIAGNLAIDQWRRLRREQTVMARETAAQERARPEPAVPGSQPTALDMDMSKTFGELKPQERALLWLAYVEESGHDEIAASLGLAPKSVRVLLFRARRRLASLLRQKGWMKAEEAK